MKILINSIILLISLLFVDNTYSQGIVLKGNVISKEYCKFLNEGGYYVEKSEKVYNTFFKLSDIELSFSGNFRQTYKLTDKKVDDDGDRIIIHYYAENRNNLYIVAVRDCEDKIQVAVFPMDGKSEFVQYKVKLFKK